MPVLFAVSQTVVDKKDAATFRRKLFGPKKIVKGAWSSRNIERDLYPLPFRSHSITTHRPT